MTIAEVSDIIKGFASQCSHEEVMSIVRELEEKGALIINGRNTLTEQREFELFKTMMGAFYSSSGRVPREDDILNLISFTKRAIIKIEENNK